MDASAINSLDNIMKFMPQTLKSDAGGKITARSIYCGHYQVFYLKSAYYIDINNAKVSVPVVVNFGNSTSIEQANSSVFQDGLGVKMPGGRPFGYLQISCNETIQANTDLFVNIYVANGDVIDNIQYISAGDGLKVYVQNFPDVTSSAFSFVKAERVLADCATNKTFTFDGITSAQLGLNNYRIYTADALGSYINYGVKTTVDIKFRVTAPTTQGRIMNYLRIIPRLTLSNASSSELPVAVKAYFDTLNTDPDIPLTAKKGFIGQKPNTPGNAAFRFYSHSMFDFDLPLKVNFAALKVEIICPYRTVCEDSYIDIALNIV